MGSACERNAHLGFDSIILHTNLLPQTIGMNIDSHTLGLHAVADIWLPFPVSNGADCGSLACRGTASPPSSTCVPPQQQWSSGEQHSACAKPRVSSLLPAFERGRHLWSACRMHNVQLHR